MVVACPWQKLVSVSSLQTYIKEEIPMTKKIVFFVLVLVLSCALVTSVLGKKKVLVMGANPQGTVFYAQAAAFAKVIGDNATIKVELFPHGATQWYPMLETEEAHFGLVAADDFLAAYLGEGIYKEVTHGKGYPLRTLLVGDWLQLGLVVPRDSDVRTVQDVKGKRTTTDYGELYPANLSMLALLANGGLTPEDVTRVAVTNLVTGVRAIIERRADVSFMAVGGGVIEELDAARGARFISLDDSAEALERMQKISPSYYIVKAGPKYTGVTKEINCLAKDVTIAASAALSNDDAYILTKTVWEHLEELFPYHPRLKNWSRKRFASKTAVVPYHPGAIKLYKEKGFWPKELEEHQEKLMTLK
jgi:hypothetical protein